MPTSVFLLAFTALLPFPWQRIQDRQASPAEAEVRKLECEWLDAYEKRDAAAMGRIVGDTFTITFPNGSMQEKAAVVAMIKRPRLAGQPPEKFRTEDVKSRAYGDPAHTVILTGKVISEFVRDGKTVTEEMRYTDTYVRVNGRWQVVSSHLSQTPPPRL